MLPFIQVFGLKLPMFGIMLCCGMLAAFLLLFFIRRRFPFSEDDLFSVTICAILLGMLGAKLLYWIVELDEIIADPSYLLRTLTSGLVFYGALIGGAAGLFLSSRKRKLPFFGLLDLFAPPLVLAQGFGRIGCFCAGCCYGSPSNSCIAVTYPPGCPAPAGVPLLPTQLMESAFLFLLTVGLVVLLLKKKPYGTVTGWYFILYGIWRFIIEFFRSDDRGAVGTLSTSQFIGIFIILAGVGLLALVYKGVFVSRETMPSPARTDKPDSEEKASCDKPDSKA